MELVRSKRKYSLGDFLNIVEILRSYSVRSWDRTETHSSIRSDIIEHAYEVVEAIDLNDPNMLEESLGDVLLQIALHCDIEEKKDNFSFEDVVDEICRKVIVRHPHIFSNSNFKESHKCFSDIRKYGNSSCEFVNVRSNRESPAESVKNISRILPSLMRTTKIQNRAAGSGYGIFSVEDALNETFEKLNYLEKLILKGYQEDYSKELGDLLFSITEVSRLINVDAESALYDSCERFKNEFLYKISLENRNKV